MAVRLYNYTILSSGTHWMRLLRPRPSSCLISFAAPALTSSWTTSTWPLLTAKRRGVQPETADSRQNAKSRALLPLTSYPTLFQNIGRVKQVSSGCKHTSLLSPLRPWPAWCWMSFSAPASSSARTISTWPLSAA